MSNTIVFVHGAFMTPLCWEKMLGYFEGKGYTCLAPAWPHKDVPIEQLRKQPQALAGLGVTEIVDHYERVIRGLNEPPILIGHSFGGLFVQMLLDRGVGVAGVAIDPAPPRGVLPMGTALKANAWILFTWRGWKKVIFSSLKAFSYAFVHTLPAAEQRAIYEKYVVPETGRIFFQAGFALLDLRQAVRVNFRNAARAPLLITAGLADKVVPALMVRANFKKYRGSPARTDFKEFPGQTHWLIAQQGWEDVAGYIETWLREVVPQKD
ncbi:MAG TPA: alpha/beta hydrolase [Ktedonobacterales bacterium]|nr:alpha/beta hydrolase [Ktedonobacterales bacterium]